LITPSFACPNALTAIPALKSKYFLPSVSHTYEPFPWDSTKPGRAYTGRRYWDVSDKICAVASEFVAGEGAGWVGFLYLVEGAVRNFGGGRGED
jgi:hypothetical protein